MSGAHLDRLLERLPHGESFRFLSAVTRVTGPWPDLLNVPDGRNGLEPPDAPRSIEGVWRIAGDEWFLRGHFPKRPLVPGVLIMEALAQLAGVLLHIDSVGHSNAAVGGTGRLALVEGRFLREVTPPVEIRLRARLGSTLERLGLFDVEARVDDGSGEVVVARGRIALQAGDDPGPDEAPR